jgi:hypothetical protein
MAGISDRVARPRDVKTMIKRCMVMKRPVMVWGPPGIGKSDLMEEIGREQNRPVIDMRLLLLEPTDIKGIPFFHPETKTMKWAKPSELPGSPEQDPELQNAILFLDEINAAPPSVQAAAYQLVLNRRVGEYRLPDGVSIVCAGNRESDKGVTFRMPSPLANRLVHVEMEANFEDWQKWAIMSKVHPDVVGYLSHHKNHLFNFNPKSPDKAFATPRSWAFVGQLVDEHMPESLTTTLVAGTVGEGLAIEFQQHRRISAKMPKPDDVLMGLEKKLNVKEISAMYSLTISMCYTLNEWYQRTKVEGDEMTVDKWHECVDNFFQFMMDNFQTEMIVLGAKTALRDYDLEINHRILKTFRPFHDKYGAYILED